VFEADEEAESVGGEAVTGRGTSSGAGRGTFRGTGRGTVTEGVLEQARRPSYRSLGCGEIRFSGGEVRASDPE
jgi:hypothetical protein